MKKIPLNLDVYQRENIRNYLVSYLLELSRSNSIESFLERSICNDICNKISSSVKIGKVRIGLKPHEAFFLYMFLLQLEVPSLEIKNQIREIIHDLDFKIKNLKN